MVAMKTNGVIRLRYNEFLFKSHEPKWCRGHYGSPHPE